MSLKITFMGTPEFAKKILESIHNSKHEIQAVYTKPSSKKDRGQKVISSPVFQFAKKNNILVRSPLKFDNDEYDFLKNLKSDVIVVVAFGKILPKKILELPKILFINIHASILPKWRGAAPIQRAIMNMDKETGISIMKIIPELDAGPVMKVVKTKISPESTYESLNLELSNIACKALIDSLELIKNKKEKFISQDPTQATYAQKIDKKESKIKWNIKAKKIIAKINALYPSPGSWFEINQMRIKVLKAIEVNKKGKPGEIIDKDFTIGCSNNAIRILKLKPEGKKEMSSSDFLLGYKLEVGKILDAI